MSDLTAILVPESERTALASTSQDATLARDAIRAAALTPQQAADFLPEVKRRIKDLEAKRKSITTPLHAAKKAVDDLFRPIVTAYEEAEAELKGIIARAEQEARARQAAALQAAVVAPSAAASSAALAAASAAEDATPTGVGYRYKWEYTVEDLGQVPVEFLTVNHAAVRMWLGNYSKSETVPDVPGLVFHRETTVVARAGK